MAKYANSSLCYTESFQLDHQPKNAYNRIIELQWTFNHISELQITCTTVNALTINGDPLNDAQHGPHVIVQVWN